MIQTIDKKEDRVCQGDIFRDVEFIESAWAIDGTIEISKIVFPYVVVLTQDCDLEQDFNNRNQEISASSNRDKYLISTLVAPLYNIEHVYTGEHLDQLGTSSSRMQQIPKNKTQGKYLRSNQLPRYHYLEFGEAVPIPNSVIDFKHYFSINVETLSKKKEKDFICKIAPLYRENISHRFAGFLSRVGLPVL